jgi:hypothetical protein
MVQHTAFAVAGRDASSGADDGVSGGATHSSKEQPRLVFLMWQVADDVAQRLAVTRQRCARIVELLRDSGSWKWA